ncbi:DUF503 domain-containing protein [Gracilibacillus alcaliphilus]|uniref:DUF503 domain-containing protein n=1 Tax=Gracilibacillus alcaliphilus TaxID=1401441 RepID=UPI001958B90E|nr:DUF503 domain-containing protein [Gracilibacillus alcaliphilus]MBM7677976.1 uncharacterized protein YlxP (DUF503 family) [Gracilibacillus alcaliphilus]
MLLYAEVEIFLPTCHSLKDKRSILKRIKKRLSQTLNITIAEMDYQDLWQRTMLAIATVSDSNEINEQVMQQAFQIIDSFPEVERTLTNVENR